MIIYFFTILLLFVFSLLEENYRVSPGLKQSMIYISFILLVMQVGLRWETGTDWIPYFNHFTSFSNITSIFLSELQFEYGYGLFVWTLKSISPSYTLFLLVHAFIYYFLIFKSFGRYTPNLYLSLLLFYTLSIGFMGSNRQLIALAICIYAVRFIIDKKPFLFLLLIFISVFFHTTALIFVIYYFLNRNIKPVVFLSILIFSFVIGKTQLPFFLFSSFGDLVGGQISNRTFAYTEGAKDALSDASLSIIGLFKRLVFLSIFYYNRRILREKLIYYNILLNGYFVGIVIYFLFANTLLIIVNRGSLYFTIMEPLLIASQMVLLKGKDTKLVGLLILLVFSVFFFYQSIASYPELFIPYKGIFINSQLVRYLH